MVALALGLSTDLYVVFAKVLASKAAALAGALGALVLFFGMWFGVTLTMRARRGRSGRAPRRRAEAHA